MFKYSQIASRTTRPVTCGNLKSKKHSRELSPPVVDRGRLMRHTQMGQTEQRHGAMRRSRSCQNTMTIGSKSKSGDGGRQGQSDRRWWLEQQQKVIRCRGDLTPKTTTEGGPAGGGRSSLTLHAFMEQHLSSSSSSTLPHPPPRPPPMLSSSSDADSCPSCSGSPCSSNSIPNLLISSNRREEEEVEEEEGRKKTTNGRRMSREEISTELALTLQRLFPTVDHCPSAQQVFVHLVNLRAFISPPELLQKFLQHTMFVQHASAANFAKQSQHRLFGHVFAFCSEWVRSVPYDFREQPMVDRLVALLHLSGAAKDAQAQRKVDDLLGELRMTLTRLERYERAIRSLEPTVEHEEHKSEMPTGLMAMGERPGTVAQHLPHIELERLSMIGVDELVMAVCATSADSLGEQGQLPRGNVRHYVSWFNQLSALVASEVLRHAHKRHRAKCIEFFIEVARECVNVGNFNSLMAIVAGLSAQPVARLRRTWQRVDKSKLEVLQRQLDPSGNFVNYRATLKAAIWRADCSPPPGGPLLVIPFFGLLLKDLSMLFRKCVQPLPNGHFNQMMFAEFAEQIAQVQRWKQRQCPFRKCNRLLQHLLLSSVFSERSMLIMSYGYEPPETNADREQLRRVTMPNGTTVE